MADEAILDVSYSEIAAWLSSRRKLASNWMKKLREVQNKTEKAVSSLPGGFLSQFDVIDGVVEYTTAKAIRDKLAVSAERGIFGGLSGEAGEWDKIVKAYEKGNLYLGEAGQRILKNVEYEIPFLRKRMESLDKRVQELARQKIEFAQNAVSAASMFRKECEGFGIEGKDLRKEIGSVGDKIFGILQVGFDWLRDEKIKLALGLYQRISDKFHGVSGESLGVMQSVIDQRVEPPSKDLIREEAPIQETSGEREAIVQQQKEEATDIDWDFEIDEVGEAPENSPEDVEGAKLEWEEGDGIDWDIEVETAADPSKDEVVAREEGQTEAALEAEADGLGDGYSDEALRFVWDPKFRNILLDDLFEMKAFLIMRSRADPSDAVSMSFADVLTEYDNEKISSWLVHLERILDCFVGEAATRFLLLETSKNFAERLISELQMKKEREGKWLKSAEEADRERKAVQTELGQVSLKIRHLAAQTMQLKDTVERGISVLFDNRQINIMGKINSVANLA